MKEIDIQVNLNIKENEHKGTQTDPLPPALIPDPDSDSVPGSL